MTARSSNWSASAALLKSKCETPYFEFELVPKTCKSWKMSPKIFFLSGLVTKLENLFVFEKNLRKISSNWWFQNKLLPDLTSARTLKVCSIRIFLVLVLLSASVDRLFVSGMRDFWEDVLRYQHQHQHLNYMQNIYIM